MADERHYGMEPPEDREREVLVGHTLDGRALFANEAFCSRHHVTPAEFGEREPWFWAAVRDPQERERIMAHIVAEGRHTFETPRSPGPEGAPWRVESWLIEVDGAPAIVSAMLDASGEQRTAEALDFASMLLDQVSDAVVCHTLDGRIVYANQAACAERGYTRDEFLALHMSDLIASDASTRYGDFIETLLAEGATVFESEDVKADGSRFFVEVKARVMELAGEQVVVSIARDISERKHAQEAVERIAYSDPLTGLPNRRVLLERLDSMLAQAAEDALVALAFIDLDHLKAINDRHGHAAGDRVLELAARRLSASVRDQDLVARLGGDEFVVAIAGLADVESAERVAEKLLAVFAEPFNIGGAPIVSTASIGIATNQPSDIDAERLLGNADVAMYAVKDTRRNAYALYRPEMRIASDGGSPFEHDG